MNDFLQSLRGGQKDKRAPKTRRSFDNANFNTVPNYQNHGNYQGTRAGNINRPTTRSSVHAHMPGGEHQPSFAPPLDPVDIMMELLDVYTKNQELLITIHEKRVIAEERKAIALEEIAEYLRVVTMPSLHESVPFKKPPTKATMPEASHLPPSDELEAEVVKSESVEGEVVDDEYVEHQDISPGDVDFEDVDAPYVNLKNMDSEDYDTQEVEYITKKSIEDSSQEDIKKAIKVIRRKKIDPKSVLSPKRSEKLVLTSESKPEELEVAGEEEGANLSERAEIKNSGGDNSLGANGGMLPREEVMEIIQSMRSQGKTFDEVAQHLVALGQPTFSGRGEWHAQTIHRLCSKKSKKEQKVK